MGKSNKRAECLIISGIDGSGKSTIIEATRESLEKEGKKVGYIWLRFNYYLTKGMNAIARLLGLSVKVKNEMGVVWQHRFYKSKLFCKLYVLTIYFDTWVSRLKYNKMAKDKDVVICDRWVTDILADIATKSHNPEFLDGKWPNRFLKILPNHAKMFVVVRNQKALMECRLENRVDPDFPIRMKVYEKLCGKPYVTVVDNNGTIDNSVKQILKK